jgi:hypothetical protein
MEQIVLNIKDSSKLSFLMQLIKQLDFVEIEVHKSKKENTKYDFFNSAGLWSYRVIDAKELRKKAWKIQK